MQQVFNVSISIPDDVVVISKEEYLDLISDNEQGKWWDIDNLQELLGLGRSKLINDILLNPDIKKDVDLSINPNGFIVYPKGKGSHYKILATRARKYFEENFGSILLNN
ncbi:DUF771 domain-containing protein [Streptococcus ictaluri]|uniref:DUF771 domain-containing protein n=1 Tax=Streptococcus ictaluri 707-05 TaxID=764299 RepID=G5JZL7_9STRE|nr:DUF771 domain-containing protein [Streptococcus ictaluri]EHI70880.1 hypothetical protein STRIC_0729 [Streptococcus ictaluri 707-05]